MIYRIVHMQFLPGKKEEFISIYESTKEYILSYDSCHNVNLMVDERDKDAMVTWSIWDSESALDEYRASDRFQQTWKRVKRLLAAKTKAYSLSKWNGNENN